MAVYREALRMCRREADGTYTSNNIPLNGKLCALGVIDVATGTGADAINIEAGGDWIVEVGGSSYAVIIGIEQDTAEILLLGSATTYLPPPPLIHPDGLSGIVDRVARRESVTVDSTLSVQHRPDHSTTLSVNEAQARELLAKLTAAVEQFEANGAAPPSGPVVVAVPSEQAKKRRKS